MRFVANGQILFSTTCQILYQFLNTFFHFENGRVTDSKKKVLACILAQPERDGATTKTDSEVSTSTLKCLTH
jgi:hypothetical protein